MPVESTRSQNSNVKILVCQIIQYLTIHIALDKARCVFAKPKVT
jgi:hypothetical protein